MGLDIFAMSNLKPSDMTMEEYDNYMGDDVVNLYINESFDWNDNLTNGLYTFEDSFSFRAGSYSWYSGWRNRLAQLAGYQPYHDDEYPYSYTNGAFFLKDKNGPFYRQIFFTDCDGTIGPKSCAILYEDYKKFEDKAKEVTDFNRFYVLYDMWMKVFKMGANNGAVRFA